MEIENYLLIIVSIIVGGVIVDALSIWTSLLLAVKRKAVVWSWRLVLWNLIIFISFNQYWWGFRHQLSNIDNSFLTFLFILVVPMTYYFMIHFVNPSKEMIESASQKKRLNLQVHLRQHNVYLYAFAALIVTFFLITILWIYDDSFLTPFEINIRVSAIAILTGIGTLNYFYYAKKKKWSSILLRALDILVLSIIFGMILYIIYLRNS